MDLRALTLKVLLVLGSTPAGAAVPPDSARVDSTADVDASTLDALRDEAELTLDPEVLADLDALLVDPVDLERGDLERLRVLPWLEDEQLASLAGGPPPSGVATLAHLPGWDASLARRLAPFVRFAPRAQSAPPRIAVSGSPRALAIRFESAHAAARGQISDRSAETLRGHVRVQWRGATVAAGDLRYGHAQGLLAWTGENTLRAGGTLWRQARGLVGTTALSHARTVHGAGIEWRTTGSHFAIVGGRETESPLVLVAANGRVARGCELEAAIVRTPGPIAWSVGATLGAPGRRVGIETAGSGQPAVATTVEFRSGPVRVGARLELVPRAHVPRLAAPSPTVRSLGSRVAALAMGYASGGIECDAGLVQELRRQEEGGERLRSEGAVGLGWRNGSTGLEARLAWRRTRIDTWLGEAESSLERDATRALLVRFHRRLRPGWRGSLELRSAAAAMDSVPERDGRGWSVRIERERGALRPALGAGTFRTDPGISLAGPAPAGGLGTLRLRGDGVHATLGMRCTRHGLAAAAGATARWTAEEPVRLDAGWTVSLRFP